jgi:hypothetical protein
MLLSIVNVTHILHTMKFYFPTLHMKQKEESNFHKKEQSEKERNNSGMHRPGR